MATLISLIIMIAIILIALTVLFSFIPVGLWISSLAAGVQLIL